MPKSKLKTKLWRWGGILFVIILMAGLGIWFYANEIVRQRIQAQLNELGVGDVSIEAVSIGTRGVTARQIMITDGAQDKGPWLIVEALNVYHPLSRLMAGDSTYDKIELAGMEVLVDIDQSSSTPSFNFSNLSLPAKTIEVAAASVNIRQADRTDFLIEQINLRAESVGNEIIAAGTVGRMADGEWSINGTWNEDDKKWQLELGTDSARLDDAVWHNWPAMPDSMHQYLKGDADLAAKVTVKGDSSILSLCQADVAFSDSRFRIPFVDMPLEFNELKVTLDDGLVRFDDILASTNGRDQLTGSGSTTIVDFPVVTTFDIEFVDLDVATLRKLAPAIPSPLSGQTTGRADGKVTVESSLRTNLEMRGQGRSTLAGYGSIGSDDLTTTFEISPLVFDESLRQETLEGSVVVEAHAKDLPVNDIFLSLELPQLSEQLEIEAKGSGQFRLELPLATAENLGTWEMEITATVPNGSVSGQAVHDVKVKSHLEKGNLIFDEVSFFSDPKMASSLNLKIDWPLTENAKHPRVGLLTVDGRNVLPHWMIPLIERQITNAHRGATPGLESSIASNLPELEGLLNFESKFEFPTDKPEAIENWDVKGALSDSWVGADGYQLRDLASELQIRNGLLSVANMNGVFERGSLTANATLNLVTGHVLKASVDGDAVPLKWLASVGAEFNDDLADFLTESNLLSGIRAGPAPGEELLEGELSLGFQLKEKTKLDFNFEEGSLASGVNQSWVVSTLIKSKQLRINNRRLDNLAIEGEFDSREIRIRKGRIELPERGWFEVAGSWQRNDGSGQADLSWRRLPVNWLTAINGPDLDWMEGTTAGKIQLTKKQAELKNEAASLSITGSVTANQLSLGAFKTRELGFDVRTNGGKLLLENFRTEGNFEGVSLDADLSLVAPFDFNFGGTLDAFPISRIFAMPSVTERMGATKDVSGIANGAFKLSGDLATLEWGTSGDIMITAPRIDGQRLTDIKANWQHSDRDWSSSKGFVSAFGGAIELKELSRVPSQISVDLKDLAAKELMSLTKLPWNVKGTLSGEATLHEWNSSESRWADLAIVGASAMVGPVEIDKIVGKAELRNRKLSYSLDGRVLDGKVTSKGETDLIESSLIDLRDVEFPMEIQFANGSLNSFYRRYPSWSSMRPLLGAVSAKADIVFRADALPTGNGIVRINDLTWKNKRLTREVSAVVKLSAGNLQFDNLRADLQRGEISGRASVPLVDNPVGTYQLDIRQFDLPRFLGIVLSNPVEGVGFLDARISGRVGRSITGKGNLAINRSKVLGLAGRTFRVPVRFQFEPQQQTGRVEFRESRFQLYGGNVSGGATLEFGRTLDLFTDLRVSKLDTERLFSSLAGIEDAGQGDLSGRLVLKGHSIRSTRDLKGSFTGKLVRAEAFQLPLLDTLAKFIGGNGLQARDFESDGIDLHLNAGKIEFRRLNLSNSLAKIAVTGNAFVDGRLDLDVSARVERLNQPTLIDQLAGSPLSRFSGSPVAIFAQAADFLSERLVFVKIGGTLRRPQVRADAGKQLQEETIRYFLRGSQILPNTDGQND